MLEDVTGLAKEVNDLIDDDGLRHVALNEFHKSGLDSRVALRSVATVAFFANASAYLKDAQRWEAGY